jgi:hyperosmotically inducible protein
MPLQAAGCQFVALLIGFDLETSFHSGKQRAYSLLFTRLRRLMNRRAHSRHTVCLRDTSRSISFRLFQKDSIMRYAAFFGLLLLTATGCDQAGTAVSPDNTAVNDRDADANTKTPIDQNQNQADIDITAKIRKAVVDTEMSVNAQNVKIITQDGHVTLRGPVDSAEEKAKIEEIAHGIAGADRVDSQLEVK